MLLPSSLQTLGLSVAAAGMFHSDGSELILHFVSECNTKLSELLEKEQKLVQLGEAVGCTGLSLALGFRWIWPKDMSRCEHWQLKKCEG